MTQGEFTWRVGLLFYLLTNNLPILTCDKINKVVLVTGSGKGIGRAIAIEFAKNGADISIVEINEETANETAEKIRKLGRKALVVKTDVSKSDEAKNAVEKTIETFGKLDVLVNNAGIVRNGEFLSGNIMDTYDITMNVNLRSAVFMTSLAAPYLIKTKGTIINISSIAAVAGISSRLSGYAMSKAGMNMLTRASAYELGSSGVRVNGIMPGIVLTDMYLQALEQDLYGDTGTRTVINKIAYPEEVADLVFYLASDKAKSITGSVIMLDNGMSLL